MYRPESRQAPGICTILVHLHVFQIPHITSLLCTLHDQHGNLLDKAIVKAVLSHSSTGKSRLLGLQSSRTICKTNAVSQANKAPPEVNTSKRRCFLFTRSCIR
ncbi:hypothetical protein CHS0354_012062 [Potamilus streckersoni]|uniref:Uncharacterized protein n=1 Tax=Potamilus streckersoni TaxID=2493646 RepID=A0AAE0SAA4_9BIVA|nr:hypothetical protein CHS0354_012062 [Potamilus streckersoni]